MRRITAHGWEHALRGTFTPCPGQSHFVGLPQTTQDPVAGTELPCSNPSTVGKEGMIFGGVNVLVSSYNPQYRSYAHAHEHMNLIPNRPPVAILAQYIVIGPQ